MQYLTPEQGKDSPTTESPPAKLCLINPTLESTNKVRSSNAVAGNDSTKEIQQRVTNSQLKILTPSFTSSEQAARLRKSDILLKKKAPSLLGRPSNASQAQAAEDDNSSPVFS